MSLTPTPDYIPPEPILLAPARKEPSSGYHPVSTLIGILAGILLVAVLFGLTWFFSLPASEPPLPLALPSIVAPEQTKEASVSADYNSAVVGSPKPMVGSQFETQKVSLQEAALMDTLRVNQPVGKVYQGKPLKEISIRSDPLKPDAPAYQEALQLLKHYHSETRLESKCLTSHQSQLTLDDMKSFYEMQLGSDPQLSAQSRGFLISFGEATIVQLDFPCSNRADGKVSAFFHRASSGNLLLDWQSYVGYSSISWPEYRKGKPQTPIWLRALATAGDYYNFEFSDKARYLCVKLLSPDGVHSIYGYALRHTKMETLFRERLNYDQFEVTGKSKELMKVMVKTTFHSSSESDQCVNIRDIIPNRWFHFDWETDDGP